MVSYGHLIPEKLITSVPYGGINMHPSVLPFYKGPAPLIRQLECGERVGGISIIELHPKKFDLGKIFLQWVFKIPSTICQTNFAEGTSYHGAHAVKCFLENYNSYRTSLSEQPLPKEPIVVKEEIPEIPSTLKILFNENAISQLPSFKKGKIIECNDLIAELKRPTFARKLKLTDGNLNWSQSSAVQIYNKWRAFGKKPGCFTFFTWPPTSLSYKRVKIIEMKQPSLQHPSENSEIFPPGSIIYDKENDILIIHTKNPGDPVHVTQIQVEGKRIQDPKNFFHGYLTAFKDRTTQFHLGDLEH